MNGTVAQLPTNGNTAPISILCASVPQNVDYEDRANHRSVCGMCERQDYTRYMRIAVQEGQTIATLCPVCGLEVKEAQAAATQASTIADLYGDQAEALVAQAAAIEPTPRPSLHETFQVVRAERVARETDAAQFDAALLQATAKAKAAYPQEGQRIERGLAIAIVGGVTLLPDGIALAQSQTHSTVRYHVNGVCTCVDAKHAPEGRCKHRWAKSLVKWAAQAERTPTEPSVVRCPQCFVMGCEECDEEPRTLGEKPVPQTPVPAALPEAPASVNCYVTLAGRQIQVTLRDTDETRLLERLSTLLAQYPVETAPPVIQSASTATPTARQWCNQHQAPLREQHNARGSWWSHRLDDGTYCKGR